MSDPIVILLLFANDHNAYLETLKQESARINNALSELEDRSAIRIFREESADTDDIINALNRFDGAIAGFHFGGHAHGKGLFMEDAEGHAEGLAQLLGRQHQIRFVFLNGCSTEAQVQRLLQLGVPAVIATTTAIDDTKATEFAGYFYDKLANQGTIRQAFDFASDSISLKYKEFSRPTIQPVPVSRGLGALDEQVEESQKWKLFFDDTRPEALNWAIPRPSPVLGNRAENMPDYEVNMYLYPILEEMAHYDSNIEEELNRMEDDREYFEMIIKNFPWNIGSQFSLLVGEKKAGRNRLEQIISTYIACGQWLYFVPLSQLWKERLEERINQFQGHPAQVFTLTEETFPTYDYIQAFQRIMSELKDSGCQPFVGELNDLAIFLGKEGKLYENYLFLQSVREQLAQSKPEEIDQFAAGLCPDAEFALAQLLSQLAFLVKYQMVTVRDILVFNPRHLNVRYNHKIGRLNAHADERLFFFRKPKQYDTVLESDSVLLLKDPEDIHNFISLSPFFIDRNAFRDKTAELTDLYTYAYSKIDTRIGSPTFYYLKSSRNLLTAFHNKLDQLRTDEELVSDVRLRGAQGLKNRPRREEENIRPYAMLHDQFIQLLELLK
jgi:hypothetical protein